MGSISIRRCCSRSARHNFLSWAVLTASLALVALTAAPALPEEGAAPSPSAAGNNLPSDRELAESGAVVGEIRIRAENIFDIADPREDNWVFRLANKLHYRTRSATIAEQLLFKTGDRYDRRLLEESERILRSNGYLQDARIRPIAVRDGRVDVLVRTNDVWTLRPGFSYERKGGKNTTKIDFEEGNILGRGSKLNIARASTPDRDTDSLQYIDPHLLGRWLRAELLLENNSDGSKRSYLLDRPFYALDTRWAAGGSTIDDDRIDSLVGVTAIANRFRTQARFARLYGGWSTGLRNGWAWRITAGVTRDESRFSRPADEPTGPPVPADRILDYPFVGIELVEDAYEKTKNLDQIERTEDITLGTRLGATAGYSSPDFGAGMRTVPFTAVFGKGSHIDNRWTVTFTSTAAGRIDRGVRDTTLEGAGRVYLRLSPAWLFFTSLAGSRMISPDDDHQLLLGGDNGLRGYPREYQAGDRRFLFTVEQRYFTTWYPLRLFRIGGAIFFDAGRAWGGTATDLPAKGVLRDAGAGLRIGNARSSLGNVIHVDVAFPFDGDTSIERVQVLVETKKSF